MIWKILDDETNEKIISFISDDSIVSWQKDFTKIVVDHLDDFNTCIDVGSNYGFLTREFSMFFDNVYAFEMSKRIYNCFLENVKDLNNVKSYNVALYNKKGIVKSTDDRDGGQNKINSGGSMRVSAETLDSYNIENIDLIKIDVQGSEFQILEGSIETIKNNNPVIVVEILNQRTFSEYVKNKKTIELLFSLNYEIVNVVKNDYIFIKRKK